MQDKEQRKFIRLRACHLAKYRLLSGEEKGSVFSVANIKDIGGGGACIIVEKPPSLSSLIELKISFPLIPTPISTIAKIAWIKQMEKSKLYKVGVEFIDMDELQRHAVDEKIKSVLHRFGPSNESK